MAKGYAVGIASETKAFKQGVQAGIIEPLEDAQEELRELGRARGVDGLDRALDRAEGAAGDLEDAVRDVDDEADKLTKNRGPEDFERAMKDAQKATDRLGDEVEDTARDIEADFRRAYKSAKDDARDMGDDSARSFGKVKLGAEEVRNEIGQNASEALSSFRGEVEDLGQIGQDTLGGLAGTVAQMGPAGIVGAAGLGAAAAAVGILTESFTKAKEATDEAKTSAYEYALTVAESGKFADATARIDELTGSIEGLKKVQDIATITGWEQKDVLTALATGDGLPALTEQFNKNADQTNIATGRVLELDGAIRGTAEGLKLGSAGSRLQSTALFDLATKAGKATGEVDDLGNAIYKMPDGKEVVVNAATKEAYEDLDAFDRRKISQKRGRVVVDIDDSAVRRYQPPTKTMRVNVQPTRGRALSWE